MRLVLFLLSRLESIHGNGPSTSLKTAGDQPTHISNPSTAAAIDIQTISVRRVDNILNGINGTSEISTWYSSSKR